MILASLQEYYQRKAADPASGIAPPGFEWKELPFLFVLDAQGGLVQIEDTREGSGRQVRARRVLVPQAVKRSVGIAANLLWDNVEYVTGVVVKNKPERVPELHAAFRQRFIDTFGPRPESPALAAVAAFLAAPPLAALQADPRWPELAESNPFVGFRLVGQPQPVTADPAVPRAVEAQSGEGALGRCLLTGETVPLARLHPAIKGVRGAQTTGANLVSFNLSAFQSYGKEQGANAPLGEAAVFAYSTALNQLLGRDSRQKLFLGEDTTVVFWSERASGAEAEACFAFAFTEPPQDDPDAHSERVRVLLELRQGKPLARDDDQRFYVLALGPNASRLAVRRWFVGTVREIGERIFEHFADLEIVRGPRDPEFLSPYQLLRAISLRGKLDTLPPQLPAAWLAAVLAGGPYPETLLQLALRRVHSEGGVTYARAALLKALLNRRRSTTAEREEKLTVALDRSFQDTAYRLGRLFAVLEIVQEKANPGLNATIRDRYFAAASSNPGSVFPILNRLKNHHLAKLGVGLRTHFEKEIGEIANGLDARVPFPPTLALAGQGRFAVGYYHQRQDFFTRKDQGEV